MAKRSRYSRFRRLPGIYRIGERKPDDPNLEPQRIILYLPGTMLDRAQTQAMRSGVDTVQEYCERLLERAIEAEHAREVVEDAQVRRGPLQGLDAIANDPAYLAEWKASAGTREPGRLNSGPGGPNAMTTPDAEVPVGHAFDPGPSPQEARAAAVVLRHAALVGDEPNSFLPTLRRGEPLDATATQELLTALADLEVAYRDATRIDRMVAYALHRLAFEGQLLLSEGWTGAPADLGSVDQLRTVQEAVDRVLSGQDIRYFSAEPVPEPPL